MKVRPKLEFRVPFVKITFERAVAMLDQGIGEPQNFGRITHFVINSNPLVDEFCVERPAFLHLVEDSKRFLVAAASAKDSGLEQLQ